MVLGGDFFQTLPVVKQGTRSHIVHACLLASPLWPSIRPNVIKLEQNMRVGDSDNDCDFAKWQRLLASGALNDKDDKVLLHENIVNPSESVCHLIAHVYPNIDTLSKHSTLKIIAF